MLELQSRNDSDAANAAVVRALLGEKTLFICSCAQRKAMVMQSVRTYAEQYYAKSHVSRHVLIRTVENNLAGIMVDRIVLAGVKWEPSYGLLLRAHTHPGVIVPSIDNFC